MHTRQTPAAVALQRTEHAAALRGGKGSLGYELTGKQRGGAATWSSEVQINETRPES